MKKRWLKNEWRQNWKIGKNREVGRTPNWVFREKKDKDTRRGSDE